MTKINYLKNNYVFDNNYHFYKHGIVSNVRVACGFSILNEYCFNVPFELKYKTANHTLFYFRGKPSVPYLRYFPRTISVHGVSTFCQAKLVSKNISFLSHYVMSLLR